jgi:hypothetical protein
VYAQCRIFLEFPRFVAVPAKVLNESGVSIDRHHTFILEKPLRLCLTQTVVKHRLSYHVGCRHSCSNSADFGIRVVAEAARRNNLQARVKNSGRHVLCQLGVCQSIVHDLKFNTKKGTEFEPLRRGH